MSKRDRSTTIWRHIGVIVLLAVAHFFIWLLAFWQGLGQALASAGYRQSYDFLANNPLFDVLSFPLILLPRSWVLSDTGVLPYVGNSLLWGVAIDALVTLLWRGSKALFSRKRAASPERSAE